MVIDASQAAIPRNFERHEVATIQDKALFLIGLTGPDENVVNANDHPLVVDSKRLGQIRPGDVENANSRAVLEKTMQQAVIVRVIASDLAKVIDPQGDGSRAGCACPRRREKRVRCPIPGPTYAAVCA